MRLIGLTGGIASGKSTVAAMLGRRGATVIDADLVAREVVLPGTAGFDEVVAAFGRGIVGVDGSIDRAALGDVVFADAGLRAALERITHPRIQEVMDRRIAAALASPAPLVVADIALLFEKDRDTGFEGTLLVYAPPAVQLRRVRQRDGLDERAAQHRLDSQAPIDEKRARATWIIDNGGALEATRHQVESWWAAVVGEG